MFCSEQMCVEWLDVSQPARHSLLRPEMLTQCRTAIRPSEDQTFFFLFFEFFQLSHGSCDSPHCKMHPNVPPNRPPPPPPHCHIVHLSPLCRSFPPIFFWNCIHMSEGTPGSNAHLEDRHHYLQLTWNLKCVEGGRVEGEIGRYTRNRHRQG